jgi:hypothetical protein
MLARCAPEPARRCFEHRGSNRHREHYLGAWLGARALACRGLGSGSGLISSESNREVSAHGVNRRPRIKT